MGAEKNISMPSNASLKKYQLDFIDKYRVGKGYRTRSDYLQSLVDKDIKFRRFDLIVELMSMQILPMMGFFFFLVLAVLTKGLLFYLFMCIFGVFAIFLSIIYYLRHKPKKNKRNKDGR